MTIPESTEFDPADTLDLWVPVPNTDLPDATTWAAERAGDWARAAGATPEATARVAGFLTALVADPRPDGFSWRLVFIVDPDLGAAVVDLALVDPPAGTELAEVVGTERPDDLGHQVVEFARNGLQGLQAVRFGLDPAPADERPIRVEATLAVRRDVSPYGSVVVVARTRTTHLLPATAALVPLQYLLTSEPLLGLLTGP